MGFEQNGRPYRLYGKVAALVLVLLVDIQAAGPVEPSVLEPYMERARTYMGEPSRCGLQTREGPNVFIMRTALPDTPLGALDYGMIESVLFNHPLARVFVIASMTAELDFTSYWQEGYCVASVMLDFPLLKAAVVAAEPHLAWDIFAQEAERRGAIPFLLNCAVLALQITYGGLSLPMVGLLLNPFDMLLPQPLALDNTAIFVEQMLDDVEAALVPEVLEREDFERSWAPRSHADRGDGKTLLCGELLCPRSVPLENQLARRVLHEWLHSFLEEGSTPQVDRILTKLYKEYTRSEPTDWPKQLLEANGQTALAYPGSALVEAHFPDGFRYHGNRGESLEPDDWPHFHSQLFAPRAHRESTDWWMLRSSKLWLPLAYGPPSSRNVMPRSIVDLARRLLAVRIAPFESGPAAFGQVSSSPSLSPYALRTVGDVFKALVNSMAETFGLDVPSAVPPSVALPGGVGGFRTFRDLRVVGRTGCPKGTPARVKVHMSLRHSSARFACQAGSRPEPAPIDGRAPSAALVACNSSINGSNFELAASPAMVNAAISLLMYEPVAGIGHEPIVVQTVGMANLKSEQCLSASDVDAHFTNLSVSLSSLDCSDEKRWQEDVAAANLTALLDDVQDQVTVVAHSAERCELLDRLARSFRQVYDRLPVVVTCECSEDDKDHCLEPAPRSHQQIPYMTVVSVPYDYGLSNGKRLLAQLAQTEFLLVLDDDFVRSPLSCLECMVEHMRNKLHAVPLPFDLLGFPILEDERNFGAFRGQLRATRDLLLLEPLVGEGSPDGCIRVGIHPMAFLARTARLRTFKFEDQLRVGEHEHFFYSNRYFGLQAAVCFDSTFPHFRVQMSNKYRTRRERMQSLMTHEFEKVGLPTLSYLLHKHDALNGLDHDEFLRQSIAPWQASDDSCGPQPEPPVDFVIFFAMVFSTADAAGAEARRALRSASWLTELMSLNGVRWAFFVPETDPLSPALVREEEVFGDVIFMPAASTKVGEGFVTAGQLRFAMSFLRDFQFRWLLVLQHGSALHVPDLYNALAALGPPHRVVLGSWQPQGLLQSHFFVLSQDVLHLLASHRVSNWLQTQLSDASRETTAGDAINAWLKPLVLQRVVLNDSGGGSKPG